MTQKLGLTDVAVPRPTLRKWVPLTVVLLMVAGVVGAYSYLAAMELSVAPELPAGIDKAQLLKGEPTAITKLQDMRKLDDLVEIFRKEAERRGKLVDVTPEPLQETGPVAP